jgi:hypothetical protein
MLTQNGVSLKGAVTHAVFRNQGPGGETQEVIINESGGLDIKATVSKSMGEWMQCTDLLIGVSR